MTGYWLFKTEPSVFGIDDLARCPDKKDGWDGIRNYQARNFMRDKAQVGDKVLIYHSSCKDIGVAGLARISQTGLVDPTQFQPESRYFDPKSSPEHPRWIMVEVEYLETFPRVLALADIKKIAGIRELGLLRKGHRLSIMPVEEDEFELLVAAARSN